MNVESVEEIPRIAARATAQGRVARHPADQPGVAEADPDTRHPTGHDEAKFGVPLGSLPDVCKRRGGRRSFDSSASPRMRARSSSTRRLPRRRRAALQVVRDLRARSGGSTGRYRRRLRIDYGRRPSVRARRTSFARHGAQRALARRSRAFCRAGPGARRRARGSCRAGHSAKVASAASALADDRRRDERF